MALHLITGRANAGKTGLVNARIADALESGAQPTLLLPTMADVRRATIEIAVKFPVGVRVSTWNMWFEEMWRLRGDGRRLVDDASRVALVARAVAQAPTPVLERVVGTRGFLTLLGRLVARMPSSARDAQGEGSFQSELLEICGRYATSLVDAGLVEPSHAAEILVSRPAVGPAPLVLNRFDLLDDLQIAIVRGLARDTDVTVALNWEDGFAPTTAVDPTIQYLAEAATTWDRVVETGTGAELEALDAGLYSGGGGVSATGQVRFGLAGGTEAEAELAARVASEAIARGVATDRIVIAFGDLGPVLHRLRTALDSYGIPFEVDTVRPVSRTSLGGAFAAMLDLALGAGDRTTAMSLLLGPHSDVPSKDVEALDRGWRANRVSDSRRIARDITRAEGSQTARALEAVMSAAGAALTVVTAGRLVESIDRLVAAGSARLTDEEALPSSVAGLLAEDAAVSRALFQSIAEMAAVEGAPFTLADVKLALPNVNAGGTAGERSGFVQVTEVSRLRSRRFDTVVVGGLTASEAPVGSSESLSDELEAALGIAPGPDREALSRLQFYLAVSRARSELVLLRKEESSNGAALRPSVLWEEALDVYREPDDDPAEWPSAAPEPVRLRASDVTAAAPSFTEGRREARAIAAAGSVPCARTPRGTISDDEVRLAFSAEKTYSVSEIEAYLQCPYRWFYDRVVRPGEIDAEIDARAIGSLAHDLLKRFYLRWAEESPEGRVTPQIVGLARDVFAQISATAGRDLYSEGLADDLSIARGVRWAAGIVEDDAIILGGFSPVGHEVPFGEQGSELMLGGVSFRGRIDRVDRSEGALFVTDYKSSRNVPGLAKFAEDGRIQAVVYAEAARRLYDGLPVAGSVYRSLRTLAMRGFWRADLAGGMLEHGHEDDAVGPDGYEALLADTEDRIESAVDGIRAGDIARRPSTKGACGFCPIAVQCGGGSR